MSEIEERKAKHIEVCLKEKVETGSTFLEKMELIPKALPEIAMKDIDPMGFAYSDLGVTEEG